MSMDEMMYAKLNIYWIVDVKSSEANNLAAMSAILAIK